MSYREVFELSIRPRTCGNLRMPLVAMAAPTRSSSFSLCINVTVPLAVLNMFEARWKVLRAAVSVLLNETEIVPVLVLSTVASAGWAN